MTLRQISLATGGTLTLKRHVVLVRLTLDHFIFWPKLPPNAGFGIKNLQKKFSGSSGRGRPLPHPPQHGYTPCAGAQAPPLLGPIGLGNRPPKSKFTTTPLERTKVTSAHARHLGPIVLSVYFVVFATSKAVVDTRLRP